MAQVVAFAGAQQAMWAALAWEKGELDPAAFNEARVRSDCYLALAQSTYEDWKAIDDTEA
jgi:hypothetical protein